MRLTARVSVTAGLSALMLLSGTGCKRLRANDEINKGVADFKNARYESATNHFEAAVKIDPDNPNPKLYLATTYSSQIVPNLNTPDNLRIAQKAKDGFMEVLSKDPNDVTALKQIASIDFNTGKPEEAKEYQKKVITLSPQDQEAYYTVGVVDWKQAYNNAVKVLASQGLTDKGDGNLKLSKPACATLVSENGPLVKEGTDYLQKAVDINPTYEEAMSYLSLMSRRQADLECGNVPAIKADLDKSDMWAQKSIGARKEIEQKKEEKSKGGVTQ